MKGMGGEKLNFPILTTEVLHLCFLYAFPVIYFKVFYKSKTGLNCLTIKYVKYYTIGAH